MSAADIALPCGHGCGGAPAIRYPVICMVAAGYRRGQHPPLEMFMPLPICASCETKVHVQDFLLPEGRQSIAAAMRAVGKALPDFDNAWLEWGIVGDQRWTEFHASEAEGKTRQ